MDNLLDELMDLYESHSDARAELKGCHNDYGIGDYFCNPLKQDVGELKDQIKATIKKIVEISKGE